MTTFPKGGADIAAGKVKHDWDKLTVGYFSESMTGFTYQAAAHMISEGLVEEGMTMIKAIHDRYAPEKRNPYNEVEYGSHYIRAMSSYGAFIAASGFTLHEPKGKIGFSPKMNSTDFKSAFIAGNSWGTFTQQIENGQQNTSLQLAFGALNLQEISLDDLVKAKKVTLTLNGDKLKVKLNKNDNRLSLSFKSIVLSKGDILRIEIKNQTTP